MNKLIISAIFALCASPAFAQGIDSVPQTNSRFTSSGESAEGGIINAGYIAIFTCYVQGANNMTYYSTAYNLPQAQFMAMQNCLASGFMCQPTGCQ